MDNNKKNEVVNILNNMHNLYYKECLEIYTQALVNEGKITAIQVSKILNNSDNCISLLSTNMLYLLYSSLYSYDFFKKKIKSEIFYFTQVEIEEGKEVVGRLDNGSLPVALPLFCRLSEHSYLTAVSLQQLSAYKSKEIIRWKQNLQRETVVTKIGDEFISRIAFDINRAKAIGQAMGENKYFPDALRWHIIAEECEYEISDNNFILNSGYFAEIDGQHRDKGSEYALEKNPLINIMMPVIITIGNRSMGQAIINQNEQRSPLNKNVVSIYADTAANHIAKKIINSENLDSVYKFCDTVEAIEVGGGFVLKSLFSEAINKFYKPIGSISKIEENNISNWIIEFLNYLSFYNREKFENYKEYRFKDWSVNYKAFYGYIKYSGVLFNQKDWQGSLSEKLRTVDFSDMSWINSSSYKRNLEKIFS